MKRALGPAVTLHYCQAAACGVPLSAQAKRGFVIRARYALGFCESCRGRIHAAHAAACRNGESLSWAALAAAGVRA